MNLDRFLEAFGAVALGAVVAVAFAAGPDAAEAVAYLATFVLMVVGFVGVDRGWFQ